MQVCVSKVTNSLVFLVTDLQMQTKQIPFMIRFDAKADMSERLAEQCHHNM